MQDTTPLPYKAVDIERYLADYKAVVTRIIEAFCVKQDMIDCFEFWVSDRVGGICYIADYYLSFDDILFDMEHECPKHEILRWYNQVVETGNLISYETYLMTLTHE